ncbi:MAG TPA: peptidase M28, partial [Blastocatellia bacterium]|nr:peptidase M28 [Blastocatellia bacterium]
MYRQSKKSLVFLLMTLIGLAAAPVHGQKSDEKLDTATIDKIKEEGMKHSHVMETLSYLTDVYGPRLTGSPNVKAAEEWAQKQMREWGL